MVIHFFYKHIYFFKIRLRYAELKFPRKLLVISSYSLYVFWILLSLFWGKNNLGFSSLKIYTYFCWCIKSLNMLINIILIEKENIFQRSQLKMKEKNFSRYWLKNDIFLNHLTTRKAVQPTNHFMVWVIFN